ncbi:MAG: methyltransferase domain-containing protein [Lysobacteraceae bacterium]|nr:MAG: methyltransferase domain-containing protein [Xanthomonadaceae bacterium]
MNEQNTVFDQEAQVAAPMMSAYLPMMKTAAMTAAAELGVFHRLSLGAASVAEAALDLDASVHGMDGLLRCLAAFGLLDRGDDGRYHNSAFVEQHFSPTARVDLTPGLLWNAEALRLMTGLTDAVRNGGPAETMWAQMTRRAEMGASFSRYMEAFARYFSPDLLECVQPPPDARRLLDIGGSHGLHAASLCMRYPQLHAVVFDLAESLTQTPRIIEEHGLRDRITLRVGDAKTDDFGTAEDGLGFDVVLLLSVLHNLSVTHAEDIVRRAARALAPGGLIAVHEHFHDDAHARFTASFQLTLLVEVGTGLQDPEQVQRWLREEGCALIRRHDLPELGKGSILLARREV